MAEAVVSRASVPVLLIRATEGVRPVERFDVPQPEFVVPLDGSGLAEATLPLARELAGAFGGHLVLVCVIPTPGQLVAEQGRQIVSHDGDASHVGFSRLGSACCESREFRVAQARS